MSSYELETLVFARSLSHIIYQIGRMGEEYLDEMQEDIYTHKLLMELIVCVDSWKESVHGVFGFLDLSEIEVEIKMEENKAIREKIKTILPEFFYQAGLERHVISSGLYIEILALRQGWRCFAYGDVIYRQS